VVQTEKKLVKMNEEIKKSLSLDNAVSKDRLTRLLIGFSIQVF